MRFLYTLAAMILTALLLLGCAGCGSNGYGRGGDEDETRSAEQSEETPSDATAPPETSAEISSEAPVASAGYAVGDAMSDFSVPLVGGGTFTLSEHRGKPVFINLFATWCGPCVAEMPEIDRLCGEYGDRVVFIAIDLGEDEATAQKFAEDNGFSLPFAYSENGEPFNFLQYIPDTFVLNADGVIVAFHEGGRDYDTFKAAIETALNS